jgi:quercetin dioxygenase-like cupin family protein
MTVRQTKTLESFSMHGLTLRPFAGEKLMLLRVEALASAEAPAHSHPHEQISLVVSGRVRFRVGDNESELGPGDAVHISSGVEHAAIFLEETVLYDLYHPVREDMIARLKTEA